MPLDDANHPPHESGCGCDGCGYAIAPDGGGTSRRSFLLLGIGLLLTGCGATPRTTSRMPGPVWRPPSAPAVPPMEPTIVTPSTPGGPPWLITRNNWTSVRPMFTQMDAMRPIHSITVHHDGMRPFFENDDRGAASRLELIRRSHRDARGWGDIGYHYAVDRGGRVWECRPLTHQGAHVKDYNDGNIGVLALGNFDQQTPTPAQLEGLTRHVNWLMRQHRVPVHRVRTHREWEGARTACPGTTLQRYMDESRRSGRLT